MTEKIKLIELLERFVLLEKFRQLKDEIRPTSPTKDVKSDRACQMEAIPTQMSYLTFKPITLLSLISFLAPLSQMTRTFYKPPSKVLNNVWHPRCIVLRLRRIREYYDFLFLFLFQSSSNSSTFLFCSI